jgi:hypothetical protein
LDRRRFYRQYCLKNLEPNLLKQYRDDGHIEWHEVRRLHQEMADQSWFGLQLNFPLGLNLADVVEVEGHWEQE